MIFKKANFKSAKPIWLCERSNEMNLSVLFEAKVTRESGMMLHLCAQNSYQVFVNDTLIHSGPARAGRGYFRVDHLPLDAYLHDGENRICVLVFAYHCNNFYLINQGAFFCAEIIAEGRTLCATGDDSSWSAYIYEQKLQRVQRYAFQRTFCEVYDFSSRAPLCVDALSLVKTKEQQIDTFIEREVSYPELPFESYERLSDHGIASLDGESGRFNPWWYGEVGRSYSGFLKEDLSVCSTDIADALILSSKCDTPSTILEKNTYFTAQMRCNLSGFIQIELECVSNTTLCVIFDELELDGKIKYDRSDCANVIIYKLGAGKKYKLISAEPYTFKHISLISLGGEVRVSELGIVRTDFNRDDIIVKLSDRADEQIARIYYAGIETFCQNAYDIFMDCPSRERAGWLCDSFFTSRVEYLLSGRCVIEASFLSNFLMEKEYAKLPKGMLPMCYPADHMDGNFIPNWAMWYVLELSEHIKRSGNSAFAEFARDRVYSLLDYFRAFEDKDGVLVSLEKWIFVEWSECNNLVRDISYPTNMLYYKLKRVVGELYNDSALLDEASALRRAIRARARLGLFFGDNALLTDGEYKMTGKITETCQYYAFFTGVATPDEDAELWHTMLCDFGPKRRKSGKWSDVYFSNAFIGNYLRCELLMLNGERESLEEDIRSYFDYMAIRTGTLWEYVDDYASCNHGFASHVLIWLDYLGYIDKK